jgi:hypothetical protein
MTQHRFPLSGSVEDIGGGSAFLVKDSAGLKLGYFDYEEELGRRSAAKMLTKDEARRISPTPRPCGAINCREVGTPSLV